MSQAMRLAIVGCGEMGISRAVVANALPEYELVCLVEQSRLVARIAGRQFGIPCYRSLRKAMQRENFDVVMICTPPSSHSDVAIEAASAGKHVLCEKPLGISLSESKRMLEAASRSGVVHQVGYDMRFHPIYAKGKQVLDAGVIGEVRYLRAEAHDGEIANPVDIGQRRDLVERQGLFGAFAVHVMDMVLWYGGEIAQLASLGTGGNAEGLLDFVSAVCRFRSGAHGIMDFGWSHHGIDKPHFRLTITGTEGSMWIETDELRLYLERPEEGFDAGESVLYGPQVWGETGFDFTGKQLSREMEAFAAAIVRGGPGSPSWEDGYRVDELVAAMGVSSIEPCTISLPLTVRDPVWEETDEVHERDECGAGSRK